MAQRPATGHGRLLAWHSSQQRCQCWGSGLRGLVVGDSSRGGREIGTCAVVGATSLEMVKRVEREGERLRERERTQAVTAGTQKSLGWPNNTERAQDGTGSVFVRSPLPGGDKLRFWVLGSRAWLVWVRGNGLKVYSVFFGDFGVKVREEGLCDLGWCFRVQDCV